MPYCIDDKRDNIRDHRNEEGEFDKLLPAPRAFEVFTSKIDDSRGDDK